MRQKIVFHLLSHALSSREVFASWLTSCSEAVFLWNGLLRGRATFIYEDIFFQVQLNDINSHRKKHGSSL